MTSRFVNKLKGITHEIKLNPKVPRGVAVANMAEETKEELGSIEEEGGNMKQELLHGASKVVTVAAGVEATFKMMAIYDSFEQDGAEETGKKVKGVLGVSGSDASWEDVNDALRELNELAQEQEEEIRRINIASDLGNRPTNPRSPGGQRDGDESGSGGESSDDDDGEN